MSTFTQKISRFQHIMDSFPSVFEQTDVEALDILLDALDPFMGSLRKELPKDFDGDAFARLTKSLSSLYERMGTYEKALIEKGQSDQKHTGAVTTYEKRLRAR